MADDREIRAFGGTAPLPRDGIASDEVVAVVSTVDGPLAIFSGRSVIDCLAYASGWVAERASAMLPATIAGRVVSEHAGGRHAEAVDEFLREASRRWDGHRLTWHRVQRTPASRGPATTVVVHQEADRPPA